ncbi:MAG: MarR family transcriptional regulator [Rickettsiales bacterium]
MAIKMVKNEKIGSSKMVRALSFWHGVTATALKEMPFDLSARQQAVLLNVYLEEGPHSVKNLAEELMISKPAICRALDALEGAKLVRRVRDKEDKRNVFVQRTVKGSVYLSEFADIIMTQSKAAA